MFGVIHSLEIIVIFFKRNCQYDSFHYINKQQKIHTRFVQFIIYLYNQYKNGFSLINYKKNNLIFWRINGEKNYQNFKYARSYLYCMSWIRHTLELVLKYYICDSHCKILTFFREPICTWVRRTAWPAMIGGVDGATCRWLVLGSIWSQLVLWLHVQEWTSSTKYCNFYPK